MERIKSTHQVSVVPVVLEKHPNANALSIVRVFGYNVVARTEDWQGVDRAAWLPPDSLVDTMRPEFNFLFSDAKYYSDCLTPKQVLRKSGPTYARVKAKKLRGVVSYGMLVPVPADTPIGEDVAEKLGVLHYEQPILNGKVTGGEAEKGPFGYFPKYDVDSFQRYAESVFVVGEPVFVTEKIHGANARFVFDKESNRMYCGSRGEWKKQSDDNLWWKALYSAPGLEDFCREHPGIVVYGEVYGQVQNLKYGTKPGEVRFAAFDLLNDGKWVDVHASRMAAPNMPWVPVVADSIAFNFEQLVALAEGESLIRTAHHMREGIVVKPINEREHDTIGRVQLKIVSAKFLEKDE
jgi:RNA ligase (TIGR02306 family)